MGVLTDELRTALVQLDALGIVLFTSMDEEVCRVGDLAAIQRQGLFSALFGGPSEVSRLRASLDGQLLPQIWSQGGTDCFVSKLPEGAVYGVFAQQSLDPAGLYRASQEAARIVEPILRRLLEGSAHGR